MKLSQYFLSRYDERSYIIKEKAKALYYFLMTFIVLIPIAIGAFNIVQYQGIFGTANVIMVTLLVTVIIGLLLLKKGLYNASANLLATIAALSIVVTMFYNGLQVKNTDHLSFTFYMPVIIILTALFSRVRWVIGISVLFIVSTVACTVMMSSILTDVYLRVLRELSVDYIFSITLSFILCLLIVRLNTRNIEQLEKESLENLKQRDVIKKFITVGTGFNGTAHKTS